MTDPLILTLRLDAADQQRFDALRREHFPPALNHIGAHVTMFHKLPGEELSAVLTELERAATVEPFPVRVASLRFLGRGVAYVLLSPELLALRSGLARSWAHLLGPQDLAGYSPHVTIQNKVTPARARELHSRLSAGFVPWDVRASGLDLWTYRGGPWAHERTWLFRP